MSDVKNIGNISLPETPEGRQVEYVLDGQQRLTSLFAAYMGAKIRRGGDANETDYREIYVSLTPNPGDEDQLVTVCRNNDSTSASHLMPLTDVLSLTRSSGTALQKQFGYTNAQLDLADIYRQAFTTYEFSTVTLTREDIDSAIEVFTRINTGGSILTLFEIMVAKTYDEEQKFDMQVKWASVETTLSKVGYDGIPQSLILSLLSLILSPTKECKRKTILDLEKQRIIDTWPLAVESIKSAVDYFRTTFNIPVSALLPYDVMIVPFAYWFYKKKHAPTNRAKVRMQELFWRSALSMRYSSGSESKLAADIKNVENIIDGKKSSSTDLSDDFLYIDNAESLINTNFSTGNALCKAILCLLAYQEPRNFDDNGKVLLDNSYLKIASSKNFHHFFPKAHLAKQGIDNANSIVNITLIGADLNKRKISARPPKDYISEFEVANQNIKKSLATHFIDRDKMGIDEDDYNKFLKSRAKKLWAQIEERIYPE
ncbi:hypothetical protein ABAC460_22580 [Asticcacaulis sp. AC460]|nr:hypothetical protein ABAC460_22580 [Asticcacaulis sp. AC460]